MRCPRLASVRPVGSIRVLVSIFQPHLHKEADHSWHKSLSSHCSHQMGEEECPTPHSWVSLHPSITIISPPVPPPKWAGSWSQWWATARRARGRSWPHLYCLLPSGLLASQPGHQHPSTLQLHLHLLGPLAKLLLLCQLLIILFLQHLQFLSHLGGIRV